MTSKFEQSRRAVLDCFKLLRENEYCFGFCTKVIREGARIYTEMYPTDDSGMCLKCLKFRHSKRSKNIIDIEQANHDAFMESLADSEREAYLYAQKEEDDE